MTGRRRVAMVTGATSGVGRACADRFADDCDLVLVGRRAERLAAAAAAAGERGARCVQLPLDIREPGAAREAVERAAAEFGRLDVVVAAAGHGRGSGPVTETANAPHLGDIVTTNLTAVLDLFSHALPALSRGDGHEGGAGAGDGAGDGAFVAVGSLAGVVATPGYSAYAATKHGLTGFMRSVRGELKATKVRTCVVQCGSVNTEFASVMGGADEPFVHELAKWAYRPLIPEEVADVIRWIVDAPTHMEISEIVLRATGDRDYT
jgi:3-hydroxy acid dehydrogenase / malonic semialdehyde reductase